MRSKNELNKLEQNKNKNSNFLARKRKSCKSCFWKQVKAFRFIREEGWGHRSDSSCCCFRVVNGKKKVFLDFYFRVLQHNCLQLCSCVWPHTVWSGSVKTTIKVPSSCHYFGLDLGKCAVCWARTAQFMNAVLARNHYVIRVLLNTNLLLFSLSIGMAESRWWPSTV